MVEALDAEVDDALCVVLELLLVVPLIVLVENPVREPVSVVLSPADPVAEADDDPEEPGAAELVAEAPVDTAAALALEALLAARVFAGLPVKVEDCTRPG